jgi:hypothetical protein
MMGVGEFFNVIRATSADMLFGVVNFSMML